MREERAVCIDSTGAAGSAVSSRDQRFQLWLGPTRAAECSFPPFLFWSLIWSMNHLTAHVQSHYIISYSKLNSKTSRKKRRVRSSQFTRLTNRVMRSMLPSSVQVPRREKLRLCSTLLSRHFRSRARLAAQCSEPSTLMRSGTPTRRAITPTASWPRKRLARQTPWM
mgnify:CR=1 FL=1